MAGTADPHRLKELEQLREELHEAGSHASAGSLQQYLQLVRACVAVSSIARGLHYKHSSWPATAGQGIADSRLRGCGTLWQPAADKACWQAK